MADRLPHEPRPVVILSGKARILIAGQAPGLRVHETGLPFNDASGDRLRQWLNVDRETFYDPNRFAIVPMGFCFPGYDDKGSDLPPRRECAPSWRERVMAAMPQVELILAVGQYAQAFHLGERRRRTMTATVQDWRSYLHANSGPGIFPCRIKLAQYRLAEKEPVVHAGAASGSAATCGNAALVKQFSVFL